MAGLFAYKEIYMPWTTENPPSVAKNWSDVEKRKCVAAANAVLREGQWESTTGERRRSLEERAIFACIAAAGRSKKMTMSESMRSLAKWLLGDDDEFGKWAPAILVERKQQDFKTEGGVRYRRTDYAVRGEADTPTTWKLRLAEGSSGNFTVAQIARAITAMQPGGYRGQRVQLGPGEKTEAVRNISAAIGKVGDDDQKENLRERLAKVKMIEAVDVGIKIFEVDGEPHWAAMTTNAFMDLEEETFETKVLEDYVAAVGTGEVPAEFLAVLNERGLPTNPHGELWFAHIPHSRIGEPIWKGVHEHFLLEIGKFDDTPPAKAMAEYLKDNGGNYRVSHGYLYVEGDRADKVYRKPIWKFETSVLPASWAANPWTAFEILQKGAGDMDDKQRAALVEIIGEEHTETLLTAAETKADELKAAGISFKELEKPPDTGDEAGPEPKKEQPEAGKETAFVFSKDSEAFKFLIEKVAEALAPENFATKDALAELAGEVKAIQEADKPWAVLDRKSWNRPSEDPDNVKEGGDNDSDTDAKTPSDTIRDKMRNPIR